MSEIDRLRGDSDWTDLGFVERERTPIVKVGIQLYLARSSNYVAVDETVIQLGTERY